MVNTVFDELIKTVFGTNWLIPEVIIVIAAYVIVFVFKRSFPCYIKACLMVATSSCVSLFLSLYYPWESHPDLVPIAVVVNWVLACITALAIIVLIFLYLKIDKQLRFVIKNTKVGGNRITAWKELQNIKVSKLTWWQKKKYDKHRLYLRVFLGNTYGAETELERYINDKPFYHYVKAVILNFKGKHRDEYDEIKIAEDSCNGDTDPLLHIQIILNRGVAYVSAGEYGLANDCFRKAIDFGRKKGLRNADLWLNIYDNYIFNLTRIKPDISLQKCLDILEEVKKYIDIEDPKQYIGLSNIVIEIMRQKKAHRQEIDEVINFDFEYLINVNLSDIERCVFEATTARVVCTGRLNPDAVIERLTEDIDLFKKLPMPDKFKCFKEIDYMFKDLRGPIVERNQQLKETAHWYMFNQAIKDLDEYRASLPSEAVYEICSCLKEGAGLMKNNPDQYKWERFLKNMQSAQQIYQENELLADATICYLDIMDEATSEQNVDSELKSVHMDVMHKALDEIEKVLPQLVEHPILYEVYLRLSIYCLAMDDVDRSKEYYRKYRMLGVYSINHFAPWLRGKYSIISLIMLVIGYIETVDRIAGRDLSAEIPQIQEWFKEFHERNGYFEAVVFGRVLGGEVLPLCIEMIQEQEEYNGFIKIGYIQNAWFVVPALPAKIKCNAIANEKVIGSEGILSDLQNLKILYFNINTIMPEMKKAIDRIVYMVKDEMPDYLISSEELNNLALDSWFNVVNEYDETCGMRKDFTS